MTGRGARWLGGIVMMFPLAVAGQGALRCTTTPLPGTGPMLDAARAADGAVWTVDRNAGRLLRIDSTGAARVVHAGAMARGVVNGVARGPGEAIWYLLRDGTVGRLDADLEGATELSVQERVGATGWLRRAPDGSLWFLDTVRDRIGHVAPDGTVRLLEPTPSLTARGGRGGGGGAQRLWEWPRSMKALAVAPDGALWIASPQDDAVFRVIPGAQVETRRVTLASSRAQVLAMDIARDGTVWLGLGGVRAVARIAPGETTAREFAVEGRVEHVLAADGGGAWFVTTQGAGHVAADGTVRQVACGGSLGPLVAGPDGTIWSLANQQLARLDTGTTRPVAVTSRRVDARSRDGARPGGATGDVEAGSHPSTGVPPHVPGASTLPRGGYHPVEPADVFSRLAETPGRVVVLFSSDDGSCQFCTRMNEVVMRLVAETPDDRATFLVVNWSPWHTMRDSRTATFYGLTGLPTIVQFVNNTEVGRVQGEHTLASLKSLLGVDRW